MTAARTWKKLEQYWAELHGEARSGPTGRDQPDVTMDNLPLGIECKLQQKRSLRTEDIDQAKTNAWKHGRPWILVLHQKGKEYRDDLVVMDRDTYLLLACGQLDLNMSQDAWEIGDDAIQRYEYLKKGCVHDTRDTTPARRTP